jgi:hypothetical protein
MAEIDYTAAWLALQANIVTGQRSRGRNELLATMAEIEVGNLLPASQRGFDDSPLPQRTPTARTA